MIDSAKLDEYERWANDADAENGAGTRRTWLPVPTDDVRALVAAAREAIALRALIEAHNAGCEAECQRRQDGLCAALVKRGTRCPVCPRRHLIELPGGTKETKHG